VSRTMGNYLIEVLIVCYIGLCICGNATITKDKTNVLGEALELCSLNPITGWFRDGYCRTDDNDHGVHVVCATMTENFLAFTKNRGNDLSSRRGGFPGLMPGDRWCLCAARWKEAMMHGAAPLVVIPSTHIKALETVSLKELKVDHVSTQQIILEETNDNKKHEL